MANVIYAIVFNGEIVEGFQPISVKAHMAKMLKADADKMKTLFSGKAVVIKRTADKAEAAKYGSALKKIGANIRVKILKQETAEAPPAAGTRPAAATPNAASAATASVKTTAASLTGRQADAPVPDTSNLKILPNEGNIVEPTPAPPPPQIDLSGFSVAENDGSRLVEPEPEPDAPNLDLSGLSLAENDGSPIVAPKPETPKLDAPDFGLDEPGAVLETLKEDVEEVHPDISGMSLAFPGGDLLNDDEKDKAPPPKAPDTSKLSVIAVFDT